MSSGRAHSSRPILAAALAFCAATSAFATRTLEQPEDSYEAALADVVLPQSVVDSVRLSPCSGCAQVALPVSVGTTYLIERSPVTLADLLSAVKDLQAAGRAEHSAVYVFYDTATGRVNRLVLDRLNR